MQYKTFIPSFILSIFIFSSVGVAAQTDNEQDQTLTEEELKEIKQEKKELIQTLEDEVADIDQALKSIEKAKENPEAEIDEATLQEYENLETRLTDYRQLLRDKQEELQMASNDEWQKFVYETKVWWAEVEKDFQETFDEIGETLASN